MQFPFSKSPMFCIRLIRGLRVLIVDNILTRSDFPLVSSKLCDTDTVKASDVRGYYSIILLMGSVAKPIYITF